MKINITLGNRKDVPLFFFEDHEGRMIHLTFIKKGPVELDFDALDFHKKNQLIQHIQLKNIIVDKPIEDLLAITTANVQEAIEDIEEIPAVKEFVMKKLEAQRLSKEQKIAEKEGKLQLQREERATFLLKKSLRAIRTALRGEKDKKLIRMMLELEKETQNRSTVIDLLSTKLTTTPIKNMKPKEKIDNELTVIFKSKVEE